MSSALICFTKMHGLGNDFMVVDATKQKPVFHPLSISTLANRHTGIGFDQLLLIEPSTQANFFCRIFNADGSEAEQCGNGLRCVARYVVENKLHDGHHLKIETKAGIFPIKINNMNDITVTLPVPHEASLPVKVSLNDIQLFSLSLGNPHAIIKVDEVKTAPVLTVGSDISTHPYFTAGTNVGFMEIINRHHIRLRTYERGAGETYACGSNACASAITGIQQGLLDHQVEIEFQLGSLMIEWKGEGHPIHMRGPAAMVYRGEISI